MKKLEILNAVFNVLLSLKLEVSILVLSVFLASIIPYSRVWYLISSTLAFAVIFFAAMVAWEYIKPKKDEHPGINNNQKGKNQ